MYHLQLTAVIEEVNKVDVKSCVQVGAHDFKSTTEYKSCSSTIMFTNTHQRKTTLLQALPVQLH